jgi:ATP-binding cassette subfamily F protein uup
LITHDRALLDRLATSVIGLGLPGEVPILADYQQWEAYVEQKKNSATTPQITKTERTPKISSPPSAISKKLSYKEKKELEQMEDAIVAIEEKIATLHASVQKHTEDGNLTELQSICKQLESAQTELELLFQRWEELDSKTH